MAKITWLGEDSPGVAGPSFTTAFGGIRFPKGEAVEVINDDTIARARKNPFFSVEDPNIVDAVEVEEEPPESDDLAGLNVAALREMAEASGIDHTGMSKAELREALK